MVARFEIDILLFRSQTASSLYFKREMLQTSGQIYAHMRETCSPRVAWPSSLARSRAMCHLSIGSRFLVVSNTANGTLCYFVVFSFHTSFWPGSFFYIVTLLPAIWVAELKILDEKVQNGADTCESNARSYNHEVGNGLVCSLH